MASCTEGLPQPQAGTGTDDPSRLDAIARVDVTAPDHDTGSDMPDVDAMGGDALDTGADGNGEVTPDGTDAVDIGDFGPTCEVSTDCPDDGSPCTRATCEASQCIRRPVATGERVCVTSDGTSYQSAECDGLGDITGAPVDCPEGCAPEYGLCIHTETWGENSDDTYTGVSEDMGTKGSELTTNFDTGTDSEGHEVDDDEFYWLRFDISALPEDAIIVGASLELHATGTEDTSDGEAHLEVSVGTDVPGTEWVETVATFATYDGSNEWTGGQTGGEMDRSASLATEIVSASPDDMTVTWTFDRAGFAAIDRFRESGIAPTFQIWQSRGHDRVFDGTEDADGVRPRLHIKSIY